MRKLITTDVRSQPKDIQEAVAGASGHSVLIAAKHYDISHPHEMVVKANGAMVEIAAGLYACWWQIQSFVDKRM